MIPQKRKPFSSMATESEKLSWPLHISSPLSPHSGIQSLSKIELPVEQEVVWSINHTQRKNMMTFFFFQGKRRERKQKKRKVSSRRKRNLTTFLFFLMKTLSTTQHILVRSLYVDSSWLRVNSPLIFYIDESLLSRSTDSRLFWTIFSGMQSELPWKAGK